MPVDDLFETRGERAVELHVHVQPGAGRSAVVGRHGSALKLRIGAAPVGGRATAACRKLLAETVGVKAASVELVSGAGSRAKRFRLSDVDVEEFRRQLEREAGPAGAGVGAPARPVAGPGKFRP